MNRLSRSFIIIVLATCQMAAAQTQTEAAKVTTSTSVVVEQPTTVVEASPLEESQAERLRKQRQSVEVETEQKIVEKLEQSRLEDEKKRAEKLFGGKLDEQKQEEQKQEEVKAPVAAPVYQEQQMPQQQVVVPVEVEKKVTPDDLNAAKSEIIEAIKEDKASSEAQIVAEIPKVEERKDRYYISGLVGTSEYTNASNIEGKGAAGFMAGVELANNFIVEGGFVYSNYFMDDYWITGDPIFKELDQYTTGMNVKYSPLSGRFKPLVGVGAHYTYRKYYDRYVYTWSGGYIPPENEATSNSLDLSLTLGMDFGITDNFSVGFEYRYNTNLIYRTDSEVLSRQYRAAGATLVEESDYSFFLISGKVRF